MNHEPGTWQHDAVTSRLAPGERLLWSGGPSPRAAFVRQLPAGLAGLVFVVPLLLLLWFALANAPFGLALALGALSAPLDLLALWALTRPWRAASCARRTVYAITDQRLVFLIARRHSHVTSFAAAEVPAPVTASKGPGGQLRFPGLIIHGWGRALNAGRPIQGQPLTFYNLADPEAAREAIARMKAADQLNSEEKPAIGRTHPPIASFEAAEDSSSEAWLDTEETILWRGRPLQTPGIGRWAFGLACAALLVGALIGTGGEAIAGNLLACLETLERLPILLLLLAGALWPWLYRRAERGARYFVTSQRAVVVVPSWRGSRMVAFSPELLAARTRVERDGDLGDLRFNKLLGSAARSEWAPTPLIDGAREDVFAWIVRASRGLEEVLPFYRGFIGLPSLREADDALSRLLHEAACPPASAGRPADIPLQAQAPSELGDRQGDWLRQALTVRDLRGMAQAAWNSLRDVWHQPGSRRTRLASLVGLLAMGVCGYFSHSYLLAQPVKASARVDQVRQEQYTDKFHQKRSYFKLDCSYQAHDWQGAPQTFHLTASMTSPQAYRPGSLIPITYFADNPAEVDVISEPSDPPGQFRGSPLAFLAFGLSCLMAFFLGRDACLTLSEALGRFARQSRPHV